MDDRLLQLYRAELTHLREVGAEFARDYPKIAGRLGMEGMEVADPYVERLLEGFAFLAARVQLKLEAEQPRLIAHLLESIYPNFLSPVPSMVVARLGVDPSDPNLAKGHVIPRDSVVLAEIPRGQDTRCEFRTAAAVTLWPVEIDDVRYFSHAADPPVTRLPQARRVRGGLRMRLRAGGGLRFDQLGIDHLTLYLSGTDEVAFRLHELVLGAALGTWVGGGTGEDSPTSQWRDAEDSLHAVGFDDDEALLPVCPRSFSGHRLLQEAAALPQRLLFFELGSLARRLARVASSRAEIVILFARGDPALESLVDTGSLALHCVPAINLFRKRLDRILLGPGTWEVHAVPDRTRPMDYEVHSIDMVAGHGSGNQPAREFLPLYATHHGRLVADQAYYTVRREPRRLSERQKQQGHRSGYLGEEVFLSLVDRQHGPFADDLRQLSVTAWVSNRDLPTLLPADAGGTSWRLDAPGPVTRVELLRGPTRPASRRPVGEPGWSLVSQLALNHLSLGGSTQADGAAALRKTLALYGPPNDVTWTRLVDGVRALTVDPVVRRLPGAGPLSFGAGLDIRLELDELAFQGVSAFALASVLEHFFARHAAINSFTQLTLLTPQRGVVAQWRPRSGARETA